MSNVIGVIRTLLTRIYLDLTKEAKVKERKERIESLFKNEFELEGLAIQSNTGTFTIFKELELDEDQKEGFRVFLNDIIRAKNYLDRRGKPVFPELRSVEVRISEVRGLEIEETTVWEVDIISKEVDDDYENWWVILSLRKEIPPNYIAKIYFQSEKYPVEDC